MISTQSLSGISKFLSLVLRHVPQAHGLQTDPNGWVNVDDLIAAAARAGLSLEHALLRQIVATSDKQRFAFSEDGLRIRANQGHSIAVDLDLPARDPPKLLYHGTASRSLSGILATGLDRGRRHHVHLTDSLETAKSVGSRYGIPVILRIDALAMSAAGHVFRCSANGVWLVDAVPAAYLEVLSLPA
jgi:putative RNA 2'-phosphotransferase